MQYSAPNMSGRANSNGNALTLSPLLTLLECEVVALLNMLVTLARSLSNELLLVRLPFPLSLAICVGAFCRSPGAISSGSSVNGLTRMVDGSESSLALGEGRSDRSEVFIGFARCEVMVLADCWTPFEAILLVLDKSSRATGMTSKNGWCNAILTQPFHVGSEGMKFSTSSSN